MKAMILAAGLGKRMRPLTLSTPKPLLKIAGVPLIEYHVRRLVSAGFDEIIINHSWLGEQVESYLGQGDRFGACISYSSELEPLETAGGIRKALPLLTAGGEDVFLVVNGDVFTNYPFEHLLARSGNAPYVVLVPNPLHNELGDFFLNNGKLNSDVGEKYTFSGLSVLPASMFESLTVGNSEALGPLLRNEIALGRVSAELYQGYWADVGTPERLMKIDQLVAEQKIDGL